MKTFNVTLVLLLPLVLVLGAEKQPDYLKYFDPAKGFKPAQTNLSNIVLQIAGSLECYGSPEPYIRHIQAEHQRLARKFEAKTGQGLRRGWPTHLTEGYLDQTIATWKRLAPTLKLEAFAKDTGMCVREGIRGTRDKGTIVGGILNDHQKLVTEQMNAGQPVTQDFEALKTRLFTELEFDKPRIDMAGYSTGRRDAVSYAIIFRGTQDQADTLIEAKLDKEEAKQARAFLRRTFLDLGFLAQAELELGILDWALK